MKNDVLAEYITKDTTLSQLREVYDEDMAYHEEATVKELQAILKAFGLPKTGTKAELKERAKQARTSLYNQEIYYLMAINNVQPMTIALMGLNAAQRHQRQQEQTVEQRMKVLKNSIAFILTDALGFKVYAGACSVEETGKLDIELIFRCENLTVVEAWDRMEQIRETLKYKIERVRFANYSTHNSPRVYRAPGEGVACTWQTRFRVGIDDRGIDS